MRLGAPFTIRGSFSINTIFFTSLAFELFFSRQQYPHAQECFLHAVEFVLATINYYSSDLMPTIVPNRQATADCASLQMMLAAHLHLLVMRIHWRREAIKPSTIVHRYFFLD